MRRYANYMCDSARWDGFELRDDDIIVSTPPKSGTTWMQMCCLVLVHGPVLPEPLSTLAPWLDQTLADRDHVHARLAAQTHRRVIKTHTPLDGLPRHPSVRYVVVGRDPRDMVLSSANHFANMRLDSIAAAKEAAGLPVELPPSRPSAGGVSDETFRRWLDDDAPVEQLGSRLAFTVHHLRTAWERRAEPNVTLFHYSAMRRDLAAEMRRLADAVDVSIDEVTFPALVEAATFESMKENADALAPNAESDLWRDNRGFFAEGRLGGWRDLISDDALRHYDARVAELAGDDELVDWLHQ